MTTLLIYTALLAVGFATLLAASYHIATRILRSMNIPDPDRVDPDETVWIQWFGDGPPAIRPLRRTPMPRPTKSGDEYDAVSGWRRSLFWRPGERKAIKRWLGRRYRHEAKHAIREGREP